MMRRSMLCFMIMLLWAGFAQAKPVIADLSDYDIRIDSSFTGTSLLLFGARNEPGDVIVVVRGPKKKFVVQKKERIFGMWINTKRAVYPLLPDFFSMATSKPLDQMRNTEIFNPLQIGFNHLQFNATREMNDEQKQLFKQAILDYQTQKNLFVSKVDNTTFMGETLFKTRIDFPDNIPRGTYTAEIYLIADGVLKGMQSIPVTVTKAGIDSIIYNMAHQNPVLYGIICIIMAFSIGWGSSLLFRRS
jgi:uncharacterized protein (TIGR02186 family)